MNETDVQKIAGTYHAWRGDKGTGVYEDVLGFCKAAKLADIAAHGFVLTPGRFVGAAEVEEEDEPFEEKMNRLVATLSKQFAEANRLEAAIRENLKLVWHD